MRELLDVLILGHYNKCVIFSAFRMMMLLFLLNSLILLYSSFVIRSLVKSLLSFKPNLFNSHVNLSSFLIVTFFSFSVALMMLKNFLFLSWFCYFQISF